MKIRDVLLLFFTGLLLMGCSSVEETKPENDSGDLVEKDNRLVYEENTEKEEEKPVQETTTEEKKEEAKAPAETVSVQPGLGDTEEAFVEEYGPNEGDSMMGRFQGDYLLPMFAEGLNYNMKLQFEATDVPSRTMAEAKEVAKQFIPKDAKFEKEYIDGEDIGMPRHVMQYHSAQIEKLFPEFEPAGTFIVIFNYGNQEDDVFGVTIGVGDTP